MYQFPKPIAGGHVSVQGRYSPTGWPGRLELGRRRIGRGRCPRVDGVLAHLIPQLLALLLGSRDLGLQFRDFSPQSQDYGLGLPPEAVPEVCREWRVCAHSGAIGSCSPLGNPGP